MVAAAMVSVASAVVEAVGALRRQELGEKENKTQPDILFAIQL